ncbi:MAG: hypothetical protein WDO13_16725 [Verrucomicrobiota bacterium]
MLEFAIDNLDTPLGEIPLLTAEERALAWSAVPLKVDGAPTVDAAAIVEDLGKQLTAYFRDAEDPAGRAGGDAAGGAARQCSTPTCACCPSACRATFTLGGMAPETTGGRSLGHRAGRCAGAGAAPAHRFSSAASATTARWSCSAALTISRRRAASA